MLSLRAQTRLWSAVLCTVSFFSLSPVRAAFVAEPTNRSETNFNMNWKYQNGTVTGAEATSFDDSKWETVGLPHTLKIATGHLDGSMDCNTQATFDRTTGWFRKHFTLSGFTGKKVFIEFQTVMQVATVYINGIQVGKHEISGYDGFHYDITGNVSLTGDNVVAVFVDNRVNTNTPPDWDYKGACNGYPDGMDYILFGGINGDVKLHCTDNLHIGFNWEAKNAGIVVTMPTLTAASATVKVVTTVKNENSVGKTASVTATVIDAAGQVVSAMTSAAQTIAAGSSAVVTLTSEAIANPHLWSTTDPYLYKVYVSVKDGTTPVDGKYQRFGFRWVDWSTTTGFSLNGHSLKLIGVDRHSAWPFVGGAIPNTVHRREAKQIKDNGFNWVRLCHYPHDPDFLDALDELGIMAMEEAPTWGAGKAPNVKTDNATWVNNMVTAFTKMIRRDINHPGIILWNSCINHGGCYAALKDAAGVEDPTRKRGQCDIACPMCFTMNPNEAVATGGGICEEMVGFRCPTARFDNDANQNIYTQWHLRMINLSKKTPDNAGVAAWEFADNNSFHASGLTGATYPGDELAGNRNIVFQGLTDLYRIPKFVMYWYQSELTSAPMAFIANYWMSTSPKIVPVFSNCAQVELIVNGASVGKLSPATGDSVSGLAHPPFYFRNLTYAAGSLVALGYNGSGVIVARDTVKTPGAATQLVLETDADTLFADGADFARVTVSVCDVNRTTLPTATNSLSATAVGAGKVISENPIKAEAGKMIFLVQAGSAAGSVTVTASSGSLTGSKTLVVVPIKDIVGINNSPMTRPMASNVITSAKPTIKITGTYFAVPAQYSKTAGSIEVYSILGKLLYKAEAKGVKSLDLSKINKAEGVFIVRLLNKN